MDCRKQTTTPDSGTVIPLTEVDKAVATHIMKLIERRFGDSAGHRRYAQCGRAMLAQSDWKDLGCHTEVLVDSYVICMRRVL